MADIEIVIKLSDEEYLDLISFTDNYIEQTLLPTEQKVVSAIKHGTPLPKGHGRLIDADLLKNKFLEMGCYDNKPCYGAEIIDRLKPIIEADKESEKWQEIPKQECKKCKHYIDYDEACLECEYDGITRGYTRYEQEPFINKPCVSSEVCEHDKKKALDKIKAEIEECKQYRGMTGNPVIDKHNVGLDKYYDLGLDKAIKIIDEYKAEIEEGEE